MVLMWFLFVLPPADVIAGRCFCCRCFSMVRRFFLLLLARTGAFLGVVGEVGRGDGSNLREPAEAAHLHHALATGEWSTQVGTRFRGNTAMMKQQHCWNRGVRSVFKFPTRALTDDIPVSQQQPVWNQCLWDGPRMHVALTGFSRPNNERVWRVHVLW